MTTTDLTDYKASLISTIVWYRDEWHRQKDGIHNRLIEEVKAATTVAELDGVEQVLDDWFDGPPDDPETT